MDAIPPPMMLVHPTWKPFRRRDYDTFMLTWFHRPVLNLGTLRDSCFALFWPKNEIQYSGLSANGTAPMGCER